MNKIGNELILCSQSYDDTVDFRKFGNTIVHKCTINMNSFEIGNYTTYFYQMYLKTNATYFQIIPVSMIYNGDNRQRIVKRFFLVYQYNAERDNDGFLFAKEITFEVRLQNDNPDSLDWICDKCGNNFITRAILYNNILSKIQRERLHENSSMAKEK